MSGPSPDALQAELALAGALLETTHLSLWGVLDRATRRFPTRPAVAMGDVSMSYEELHEAARRAAGRLRRLGVGPGVRVGLGFHSCPEWAVLHYALAQLGAVTVPLSLALEAGELRHVLQVAEPEVLVAIDRFRTVGLAERLSRVDPAIEDGATDVPTLLSLRHVVVLSVLEDGRVDAASPAASRVFGQPSDEPVDAVGAATAADPAYLLFTSGSTAFPKPALCRHRAFSGAGTGFAHCLSLTEEDRLLGVLPTFHTGGITCMLTAAHIVGACAQLLGAFEAGAALRAIAEERCTATIAFDTMFVRMMDHPSYPSTDHSSLRRAAMGATPAFLEALHDAWGFDRIVTTYGSTESGALAAATRPSERDRTVRHHTNGRPLPGVDLVILDPATGTRCAPGVAGEICFRGWNLFAGYVGMPEATEAAIDSDGYFHSGDYGSIDDEGRLTFLGRYKMMIKTGGENVAEREVEILLENELAEVELAQVVGVPDETWGEAVVAFVQLAGPVDVDGLRDRCRGRMAAYKIPRRFIAMAPGAWPMLANGKPDKEELRALARRLAED